MFSITCRVKAMRAGGVRRYRRPLWIGVLLYLTGGAVALGQTTNQQVYQDIAWACMGEAPDTLQAIRLEAPSQMPYLRTALVEGWQQAGRTVYEADTTGPGTPVPMALLRFQVEGARVVYGKAKSKQLERNVTLAVRYRLLAPDGRILREQPCSDIRTDLIDRDAVARVESAAFPETQAEVPARGWVRRFLEPTVLATVVVLGTYLFFSLRSSNDGGG